jgi:hypothetical protein
MVVPTYPRKIADGWPGLWTQDIDAAVLWNNGKIYFFKGNQYMRYDVASAKVDPDYPRSISLNWQGLWPGDIDAAVLWNNGTAYFFKGAKYVRYDVASGKVDPHYGVSRRTGAACGPTISTLLSFGTTARLIFSRATAGCSSTSSLKRSTTDFRRRWNFMLEADRRGGPPGPGPRAWDLLLLIARVSMG